MKLTYVWIALAVAILTTVLFYVGAFSGFENFWQDMLFSPRHINPEIVIVSIDNESLEKIGQWPWPRKVFSDFLLKLEEAKPRAVGLDVIFADKSRFGEEDDAILENTLSETSFPVVLPIEAASLLLENGQKPRSLSEVKTMRRFLKNPTLSEAHVNVVLDRDGVVRRFAPEINFQDGDRKTFGYELALRGKARDYGDLKNLERIVWSAPPGSVRRLSFYRVLDGGGDLRDKISLVGVTAPDLHDEKPTPMSRGTQMAGVEIQANILNMLLQGYRLRDIPAILQILWIFIAALAPAFFFMRGGLVRQNFLNRRSSNGVGNGGGWPLAPIAQSLGMGVFHLLLAFLLFDRGWVSNMTHVNGAWTLATGALLSYRYFAVDKEKRELKLVFSKYVSGDVLGEIMKNPSAVALGGEEKEITLLFSDIRSFTTLSESTSPRELVRILNRYFTEMTDEVLKNKGVLDKYIGDAIMAFWGAPLSDENQADNAMAAAQGMIVRLEKLNEEFKADGDPKIKIGIGIYTGPAVVGNIGSESRFDYTAMGDTVNVASRLEGLNKEHGTEIIIGESTVSKLKEKSGLKFLGAVPVKGRDEPVRIYTLA